MTTGPTPTTTTAAPRTARRRCAATASCRRARASDGLIEANVEQCDDGANNGDNNACKADCSVNTCGDGFVGPGEACDDGNASDEDACTNVCKLATCGDGFKQPGEACDLGACTLTCTLPKCGDQFVQITNMEECDDGNLSNADTCLNTCKAAKCGDMAVQQGVEQCDDGNVANTDLCTNGCKSAACGDTFVQAGTGEQCDDGNLVATAACTATCKNAACGERCDPGLPAPYNGVKCKQGTCTYDFSQVPQLYCNGTCTWGGAESCDQADADIYCKLKTGKSTSVATSFQIVTALDTFGFSCPGYNNNLGPLPEFGINVNVWYPPGSVLSNHGPGLVITSATCT